MTATDPPLTILYRGPLASCNYSCSYCPFAKRSDNDEQLERDYAMLERFVHRVRDIAATGRCLRIMFTPWGEVLVRKPYREAIAALTRSTGIASVCVQTNLSCSTSWLDAADQSRLKIWATFHPTETSQSDFLRRVANAVNRGIAVSVGMVAIPGKLAAIIDLRRALPDSVYLWLNPQQPRLRPFRRDEIASLSQIDPDFEQGLIRHRSLGQSCSSGLHSMTVDGHGRIRRCHFIDTVIGNFYDDDWKFGLRPRPCSRQFCDCYLGYAQLNSYNPDLNFDTDLLARVPTLFAANKNEL